MQNPKEVAWVIKSALEANMNVLRIWGGGVYPEDHFFEQADRAGLLIWQDMMFSCKVYPLTMESFVENSVIEIRQQMGRMQHHASIVMWDLNNEGEDLMYWWGGGDRDKYLR